MTRSANLREGDVRGFVLIGVVMMVLALTILGLSLFSLSSYEAQFMNRSLDERQALQYAMGGLARARFALTVTPQNLSNVKQNLPLEYVTYARAAQLKGPPPADTSGLVVGGGKDVEITVEANYHGVRRRVTGFYLPVVNANYYKRVITAGASGIQVAQTEGPSGTPCKYSVVLSDSIWQNSADFSWQSWDSPMSTSGAIQHSAPTPSAGSFIAGNFAAATTRPFNTTPYSLLGPTGSVSYWYTDNPTPIPGNLMAFSTYNASATDVYVSGWAVWMLPRGIRVDGQLHIHGNPATDCLVIVARNGQDRNSGGGPPTAIWFFGGFISDIPVVLVSDGIVDIEHAGQLGGQSQANNISIFADRVVLAGPSEASGNLMQLSYGAGVMDPLIEQLMAAGALPNAVSNQPFALHPGTWRVLQ